MPNWKRKFMESEHERRRQQRSWQTELFLLTRANSDLHENITYMSAQLALTASELAAKKKTIKAMRDALQAHHISAVPSLMSFHLCCATDDQEMCPLSRQPINHSGPPFEGCCSAIDPATPTSQCAQLLQCGHRFNAVWLLFHFVSNRTSRCPICRAGKKRFRVDPSMLPACMVRASRCVRSFHHKKAIRFLTMQWVPTVHELYCGFIYIVVNVLTYLVCYHWILNDGDPGTARIRLSILVYGGVQSVLGFIAGMCAIKIFQTQTVHEETVWA
jgi:hypothetical protein